jgi:thiol:disulfide interchange protein DsbD
MKMSVQGGLLPIDPILFGYFIVVMWVFGYAQDNSSAPLLTLKRHLHFQLNRPNQSSTITLEIQPNYYLYQHKFEVQQGNQAVALNLPKAVEQYDENYGHSQVYYQQVEFNIPTQASQHYRVTWQGCAKDRICYPPQNIEFQTDIDGLVSIKIQLQITKTFFRCCSFSE